MASPSKGKKPNPHKLAFEPVTDSEGEQRAYGHKWRNDLKDMKDEQIDNMASSASLEDRRKNSKQLKEAARAKEVEVEVEFKKKKVEKWLKDEPISIQNGHLTIQCCGYDGLWEGAGQEYTQVNWGS